MSPDPKPLTRIRAVIADDEELARALLREELAGIPEGRDVEIVAECANGFEAVKAVSELSPDLLFLDIRMPRLDGFEVLDLIEREVAVIFITAYDEHALRAFDVHAVDYLLKPFAADRLADALRRARERLAGAGSSVPARQIAAAARPPGSFLERVLVRSGSDIEVIPIGAVDYVEAQGDYVSIRSGGRNHLKQQPLSSFESLLDPSRFVRIHRSVVLNVERLARIELYAKDSRLAILKDGSRLPCSRAGYSRLRKLLQ